MTARAAKADLRLVASVLACAEIFRSVGPARLAEIAHRCALLSAHEGAVIARRDVRPPGVFALAYGCVELVLGAGAKEMRVVRLVSPRETFCEATALLGRPSRYEAIALADSKLVIVPSAVLVALVERDAVFARNMTAALAQSVESLLAELEAATLQSGMQRLASYLRSLADGRSGAAVVGLPVRKTVVAARLGVKRETLSRLLRELADQGVIAVAKRNISILDPDRLAQAAHA